MSARNKLPITWRAISVLMMLAVGYLFTGCANDGSPTAPMDVESDGDADNETVIDPRAADSGEEYLLIPNGQATFLSLHGEEIDQEDHRGQMQTQYGLPTMDPQSQTEQIRANCLLVQAAAETYAAENDGIYPVSTNSLSAAGHTLIDLLPQGTLLRNPVTGHRTSPVDGSASSPGQVGYTMVDFDGNGHPDGYHIDGVDKTGIVQVMVIVSY